jgi:hypothetical protein
MVLDMLADIQDPEEMEAVLGPLDFKLVFLAFNKKDARRDKHDVLLFEYFQIHRTDIMSVLTRGSVISAAAEALGLLASEFIAEMILTVNRDELHSLKHALDQGKSALCDLLAQNVGAERRQKVIDFFIREGELYVREKGLLMSQRDIHVLSDIDDTFVHSGIGLGGPKYPNGTIIPGVRQLLIELKAHVVFVTARPDFVSSHTYNVVRK